MGKERQNQPIFNSAESIFMEVLEGEFSQAEMSNLRASLLMNSEQRMGRINALIERIDLYKVDRSKATLRIKSAWDTLDSFLSSKEEFLKANGITPVIYGSVTFDDPKGLDFDICLLGEKDDQELEDLVEQKWVNELSPSWKKVAISSYGRISNTGGHIEYVNFERLDEYAKALKENNREFVDAADWDIYSDYLEAASILMGEYPYSEPEKVDDFKKKFLDIVQQSSLLSAYTIWNLEQTLIQRETRRAGVADHQTGNDVFQRRKLGF